MCAVTVAGIIAVVGTVAGSAAWCLRPLIVAHALRLLRRSFPEESVSDIAEALHSASRSDRPRRRFN